MNISITDQTPLSKAEKPVLLHAAEGRTTQQTADKIFRSPRTVKAHRTNICRKLNARNMTQAVSICWANKWLKPSKALFLVCLATSFNPDSDLRPQRPSNARTAASAARAGKPKHETDLISQLQGIELADFTTPMKLDKAA